MNEAEITLIRYRMDRSIMAKGLLLAHVSVKSEMSVKY